MITSVHIPTLSPGSWNAMIDRLARSIPIRSVRTHRKWNHPWTISPQWSDDDGWVFRIIPGFVNGIEPEVGTLARLASARTLDRIEAAEDARPRKAQPVTARITEDPLIRMGATRLIGKGANPQETTVTDDGAVNVRFEAVPEFFRQFGITSETVIFAGNLNAGLQEVSLPTTDVIKAPPILRAMDVSLHVDRFTARTDILRGNGMLDSFTALYATTYGRSAPIKDFPTLITEATYTPAVAETLADINQEATDAETDSLLVATIYLLSPPDTPPTAAPDKNWRPFVQHSLFWNLAHTPAQLPNPVEYEPLRVTTLLAAGIGDSIFSGILAPLNDSLSAAASVFTNRDLSGRFWTL